MIAGRYSFVREIGRGGSGVVWLGRDEVLGREVALKRIGLLPGADQTDLARAEREARLSASLNNPHVVAIFDVVVDAESGAHWLVMEYVDGFTLGQLVRQRGRLTPDEAAPLLLQAVDALVAAHAAGIAHRDVKPSNILVDRNGLVKLTDFGIARIATDPSLTQTGMVTGSPAYLAPEIASGARSGAPADVWSLGATLFHVLAGHPPYDIGDNVLGGLYRIVNEEPPQLDEAAWLAPLLAGTMVRDPAQRWSMEQVRDFLAEPHRQVTPSRPAPPTHPLTPGIEAVVPDREQEETRDFVAARRRRPTRAMFVILGLVLCVVLGGVLYAALSDDDPSASTKPPATSTPSGTPSTSPSGSPSATPDGPTAAGMEAFIRDYVAAVGQDPAISWQMLSPKFQVESGGFETYRKFWQNASNGQVRSISADPKSLVVSYQVRFENFNNGPGPTVLQLKYDDGRYLIDGEASEGFKPAG